jgi:ketosteroid isomerase-like protein
MGRTEQFIEALHRLESERDLAPLLALFEDDAEIENPNVDAAHGHGRERIHHFWAAYRDAFEHVRSEFRHVVEGGRVACLEWTSSGALADGHPFAYDGVTVLEFDGDRIAHLRAYFDPRALAPVDAARMARFDADLPTEIP